MTDNEIIKALELCNTSSCADCEECPFANEKWCVSALTKNALDLINRLKAEIERLKSDEPRFLIMNGVAPSLAYKIKTSGTLVIQPHEESRVEIIPSNETIRAEAIKDFAERVKKYFNPDSSYDIRQYIDDLVKEMTGEKR